MPDPIERLNAALADRYRLEREIGAGGMAAVYLAEDLKHRRHVALKVLRPELAAVLGAERFVQEITTTASLQHPHILPLFDSGRADGFLYYVMPYVEGETLRSRLDRETQLGVEDAVRIATEVADALDYAHRHGVTASTARRRSRGVVIRPGSGCQQRYRGPQAPPSRRWIPRAEARWSGRSSESIVCMRSWVSF